ncbi:hypothetical protein [Ponticaulis sp.]|uniref:hypothetical protein n=1 Tax=Ponticaulis sp. TaxID=2020902 RepID=UPI000C3B6C22|nr:hypothetical protein [Ponticaulis sp.]MBN03122.1 hypothetical protein [Ponticaulis sp.]|tara:strand:+ start:780 stop:1427 length:648 start_codon:yes stop_codon:yes gene_type:complete
MGKGNKAEMLIAICAVISSIAAVFIAWDQARVMRSQEKADVWPILQLQHNTSTPAGGALYEFDVQNAGVGPALIEDYLIRIPGREDTRSFDEMVRYFITDSLEETYGLPAYSNQALRGRVIRQGDSVRTIGAEWLGAEGLERDFLSAVQSFLDGTRQPAEVFVCYCSILDDCWVSTSAGHALRPIEVNSCEALPDIVDQIVPHTPISPSTEESQS